MAQFGWPALIKTAAVSATATSGLWISAGLVWHYRQVPAVSLSRPGAVAEVRQAEAPQAPARIMAASTAPPTPPPPPATASTLTMPVVGVRASDLVDTYAQSRSGGRIHDAIDIMAPRGTQVVAAAAGSVEKLFWSNLGGITAYVRSADRRVIYYYAHLDAYAPGLIEGQAIAAGAPIGRVGFTGNANPAAPHLHFAIMMTMPERTWYQPSTAINPYPLLAGKAH
ncbi:M23 family metallopeptidase [Novosphingobium sp.]|uniref:M23 family metallopeptidase n=1 Tax=Novosphingobium sp. TaxID=1874826 RepID=UPI0025EC39A8|nr:M23 family metallopeptidase [Novosphingobium sp.]